MRDQMRSPKYQEYICLSGCVKQLKIRIEWRRSVIKMSGKAKLWKVRGPLLGNLSKDDFIFGEEALPTLKDGGRPCYFDMLVTPWT
jgi:hypothetical protein